MLSQEIVRDARTTPSGVEMLAECFFLARCWFFEVFFVFLSYFVDFVEFFLSFFCFFWFVVRD